MPSFYMLLVGFTMDKRGRPESFYNKLMARMKAAGFQILDKNHPLLLYEYILLNHGSADECDWGTC
jgi:hypothetical protein